MFNAHYSFSSSSDIEEEPSDDVPMSPQAPDLFILPPSPNYGNSVELQWLDSVNSLVCATVFLEDVVGTLEFP